MLRSSRDRLLPLLSRLCATALLLAAGFAVGGVGAAAAAFALASIAGVLMMLRLARRPRATLWLGRRALREGRLEGRIEIDSSSASWDLKIVCGGDEVASVPAAASPRGGTAILRMDVPIGGDGADHVVVTARSGAEVAAFSFRLTRAP